MENDLLRRCNNADTERQKIQTAQFAILLCGATRKYFETIHRIIQPTHLVCLKRWYRKRKPSFLQVETQVTLHIKQSSPTRLYRTWFTFLMSTCKFITPQLSGNYKLPCVEPNYNLRRSTRHKLRKT